MDFGSQTSYTIELWSSTGGPLADISALANNRSYTLKRNDTETLTFELDLYLFEAFAASINTSAAVLLQPYAVDVKVKRNGVYLFGSQIVSAPLSIEPDSTMAQGPLGRNSDSFSPTITVNCQGYLDLFKDRYVTYTYNNAERCYVAGNLITQTQSVANGNTGATLNPTQYNTNVTDATRTYTRQNVKGGIQNLAALTDAPFDFAFDSNKVFTTYNQIGAVRTDISFTYGGPESNVAGLYVENSATSLYNEIIGLGSGNGVDGLISVQDDTISQQNFFLRQDIKQYNSVVDVPTLTKDAATDLALEKSELLVPQITITGNELLNVPFISVGDRIMLSADPGLTFLAPMIGQWRVEQIDVTLDDNDFESAIVLYFDNYGLS